MAACPVHHCVHLEILLIDRNLTPSAIAFCATAPGVRLSFFAVSVPDNSATGTIMANAFDTLETS
jgi:hypothetical protein